MAETLEMNATARRTTFSGRNTMIDEPDDNQAVQLLPKKKKPKLTKAERKALQLQEKINMQKMEIRAHLQTELKLSHRMAERGRELWEETCRDIKLTEFREELQEWRTKSVQVLAKKDKRIQMMVDDMQNTQEMHRRHFSRQLEIMDYLIDSYKTLLSSTRALYEERSAELIEDFHSELTEKQAVEVGFKENCESILHIRNRLTEQCLVDDYQIYLVQRDEAITTGIEKRYRQRDAVVERMRALQRQLLNFVASMSDASLDVHKYTRINALMEKQRQFFVESQRLNMIESLSTRSYAVLQRHVLQQEVNTERKFQDLRLEQNYFLRVRKNIENNINIDRQITFMKLRLLCNKNWDVRQKYQKLEKTGELLLSLSASCRKLQTEAEKVLPWGEFQVPAAAEQFSVTEQRYVLEEEAIKLRVLDLKAHLDLTEEELLEQVALLRNFWRRQSLVEAQTMLLRQERQKLLAENEKYINFLRSMTKMNNWDELPETLKVVCLLPLVNSPCGDSVTVVEHW